MAASELDQFASLQLVHNPDPANAMAQLGHTDRAFTLRAYTHLMRRAGEDRERLAALVGGSFRAPTGTSGADEADNGSGTGAVRGAESRTVKPNA